MTIPLPPANRWPASVVSRDNTDPGNLPGRDRRSSTMTAGSRIVAMGRYQPSRVVTNDELASTIDTNDAWIRDRVGIAERRIADAESVADMATYAAEKALANS